jgi:hypothetical protein
LGEPVMLLPTISVDEIKRKYIQAFNRFYFRPRFILKKLIGLLLFKDDIHLYMEGIKKLYEFTKSHIFKAHG